MWCKLFLYTVIIFLGMLSLPACKKDTPEKIVTNDTINTTPFLISDTPKISFISILPKVVEQYTDSITIVFKYTDGNGDLGQNSTENKNLFITDSRNALTYKYRIPQLTPNTDDDIAITGNFSVKINSTALQDENNTSELLTYSVYVIDRAGNKSNVIITEPVEVVN